jgi:hypothetical protein
MSRCEPARYISENFVELALLIGLGQERDIARHILRLRCNLTRADHDVRGRPAHPAIVCQGKTIHRSRHLDIGEYRPYFWVLLENSNCFFSG